MTRVFVFLRAELEFSSPEELDVELEAFLDAPAGSVLVQDVSAVRDAALSAYIEEEGCM